MMEQDWTPEPWSWAEEKNAEDMGRIVGRDGSVVCGFGDCTTYYPTEGNPPSDNDLARLFACVNAMQGIPDPTAYVAAFEAMREALKDACNRVENSDWWWMDSPDLGGMDTNKMQEALTAARAARGDAPTGGLEKEDWIAAYGCGGQDA